MTDNKLGKKRKCLECKTSFYDFNKVPAICPKCKATVESEAFIRALEKEKSKLINTLDDDDDISIADLQELKQQSQENIIDDLIIDGEDILSKTDLPEVQKSKFNDDDIDNPFFEDEEDELMEEVEKELKETMTLIDEE